MNLAVVLYRPRDIVNIAQVVRAMKNFGLRKLRLVEPAEYDTRRIERIAHKTGDVLKRVALFDTLDDALADRTHVVGLTARGRAAKRSLQRPRDAAPEIRAEAVRGRAALVLGPEDKGLTNAELDRCHRTVTIPTDPTHASLNLAQAFCIVAYELFAAGDAPPFKEPKRKSDPVTTRELETLFADVERGLWAIEFFKTRRPESVMRSVREVVHRANFDQREAKLTRAMAIEVVRFLQRTRVPE